MSVSPDNPADSLKRIPTMKPTTPDATVIIAVYNHFEWLRLILDALRMQTRKDFEIIIADDGSNPETVESIKTYMARHPEMDIRHSWQEDMGWRKNESLNKAVRTSRSEYLIFVDGDCVPHPKFVEDHMRLRRRHCVVGGRRVDMSEDVSAMVESWDGLPEGYFRIVRKKVLSGIGKMAFGKVLSQLRRTMRMPFVFGKPVGTRPQGFLGCNMGMYKGDLEALNGFDEDYVNPGTGEDTDLELRWHNKGWECMAVPRYALMLHRCHKRLPLDSPENKRILKRHEEENATWIANGLVKE